MNIDKRTTNSIALFITIIGWLIGMFYNLGFGILVIVCTFFIMKLTKQTSSYPFDWLIKILFPKKNNKY